MSDRKTERNSILRVARLAALFVLLVFLAGSAGRAGLASLLATSAARSGRIDAANAAVTLSQRDAQNHLIRGSVLQLKGDHSGAAADYSRAVSLRPDDYILWLALAHARELSGDSEGAIAAATRAVILAPNYAKPHWQLGNLLLRSGRIDGGLGELRLAGSRNPALLQAFIDLAWQLSNGNVQSVLQTVDPRTPETYTALAHYFRKREQPEEAIAMFRAAGVDAGEEVTLQRRAYLAELLTAKQFKHAYQLWLVAHPADPDREQLADSDFEQESDLDEPGFGWRAGNKADAVSLTLDASQPSSGQFSLQVSFNGNSDPGQPVISQLALVSPETQYQLRFVGRTQEIVSGGLPEVVVIEAGSGEVLGKTGPLPQNSGGWRDYQIDFTTPANIEAIQIRLQRTSCSAPCPIFGRLWFDSFSLRKL